ncbi:hypothetical protein CLOSTHATH_03861 [Hungatella hathewayi DSM 13479]|uniref:Uncharacterized protein n=1 Tax=Hungatella hathewayi DSM 13479 TaxID=566550 RepID=D3AJS0_9FIRM|nr:hypothetical protein CLOSTHATH_03861 [Hungatella hathewayi DSM 13479]
MIEILDISCLLIAGNWFMVLFLVPSPNQKWQAITPIACHFCHISFLMFK